MARSEWTDGLEILDLVHESIFARTRDLRITFWNAAAEELYGWTRDEALGRNADELLRCVHPLSLEERESQLFATGRWQGEFIRRTKSGSEILVDVTWSVRRDEAGAPIEVVETGRDITEKRRDEEAKRLSEYRFRNLFQAMAVGFCEVDFNGAGALLIPLRDVGVTDLRQYLVEHPETVRQAMRLSRILDVNDKMLSLLAGSSKEEMVGSDVERFWPEASVPVFIEALVGAMEKRPHLITETRLRDLKGDGVDVLFTVSWSPESRKRGVILLGIIDIGDRKRAHAALEESETKYRNLFNFMPIALWQLDSSRMREMFDELHEAGVHDLAAYVADHPEFLDEAQASLRVTEANEQTLKLFGAEDRETLLPQMPGLWLDRGDWAAAANARLSGQRSYQGETRIRTLDGRLVDVVFSVAFADTDNPNSVNIVGAIDVSELKAATTALARSELKYRDLFNYMPLSLCQLDVSELVQALGALRAQGVVDLEVHFDEHPDLLAHMLKIMHIEQVNEQTVRMFGGHDPAEFVGPIARFWQGSEDTVRRSLAARYAGAEAYAEETRLTTLDGRVIDVFFTSAFPKALSELGIGLVGMIDIGDRLQAEHMLQQVQADFAHAARVATLGELTASIAHEINQPLAAIATNGEASLRWLARPEPDVGEVRTLAARMVADARRAADVIARIRAMATGEALEHEPISINGAVEDALSILRRELQSNDVTVEFSPGSRLSPVKADRTQIQQVLVNLAINAIQAMSNRPAAKRRLTVRTGIETNGFVRIEVDDTGPGVPEEHVTRLFDSFFTTKKTGLGIGLSICRSIIEAHSGRIRCENLSAGGARFTVSLPAAAESESRPAIAATHTKV